MKTTLKEKIAYRFDNYIAKGAFSIFMAMLIVFFLISGCLSLAVLATSDGRELTTVEAIGSYPVPSSRPQMGDISWREGRLWRVR